MAWLGWMALGAVLATLYSILTHRRHTPYLALDLDALAPLNDGLTTIAGVTGAAIHAGNKATLIQNGAFFDAIARDISGAHHTIHLETFVWTRGEVERQLVTLLCERARAGVKVRVLIDAIGGISADRRQLQRLEQSGAELAIYCKPRWWNLRRINHRTHRKLLIVDGEVGYTFGHGIADTWRGNAEDKDHWRDTAVRLAGPVVSAMQSVFMENWIEETKRVPAGPGCFPELKPQGEVSAHVVSSASGDAVSDVSLLYTTAIACARREVIIQNPYFAPDDGVCELLVKMVSRGVQVHLMVPGRRTDNPFVRRAGAYLYPSLLRGGVRVYEYEPTLLHQKIVVVDQIWSHVGSTNFDSRSLAVNEEVGIGMLNADIALELKRAFHADLACSREVTLERWRKRPWRWRAFNWVAYQLHDLL
jgi:cardiolipin synthase